MFLKLFAYFFAVTLAAIACEGYSWNYYRNPNYKVLSFRNGGLSNPNPVPTPISTADVLARKVEEVNDNDNDENENTEDGQKKVLSGDIYNSLITGSGKIKNNPNDLLPIMYSMRSQLRQLVRSHNESEVTNKNILSVLQDTLSWAKAKAASFYSLILTFT